MKRLEKCLAMAVVIASASACGSDPLQPGPDLGVAPGVDGGVLPDTGIGPGPDVGPRPDTGPVLGPTVTISGKVYDLQPYLQGQQTPVPTVEMRALGVQPPLRQNNMLDGSYSLQVPTNGKVVVAAAKPQYRSTYTEVTVGDQPVANKNIYLASDAYVTQIGNAHQVNVLAAQQCHPPNNPNLQCRYAVIMGRLVDDGSYDNGTPTPVAGILPTDFTVKGEGDATWYKKGPYFTSATGTPGSYPSSQRERDPVTNKYRGGIYVIFVEVPITGNPPKEFEISVRGQAGGQVYREFGPVLVKAFNGGLSWVTLPETGTTPVQPPPPPPPPQNVAFDTQIYPLFLPVAQGGYGCAGAGCHSNQGGALPAAGMNLYGGPAEAYASLNPQQYPQRVNLANPAQSYLLKRPLYEADGNQDHPIFAFVSEADPGYQTIYAWIREGAVYNGNIPPPQPVSFYNEIRPLLYQPDGQGGIGCYNCHVLGVDAATAPGGFYMGGNGNELYAELTQETPLDPSGTGELYRINKNGQPALSLVLLNPLLGSIEPHPAKLLQGTNDPRYQLIYRWISEGYQNDTP
jgi:hypothetical protein